MAQVTKGRTFTSGETVTPAKLNELVDNATVTAIQTADISDSQVTNAKIASGVDASKLTTGTLPIARIADAAVTPAKLSQPYTLATAQASTSGASIDFTGIPSWARKITVGMSGVSTNGSSGLIIQLGTGSTTYTSTGYAGASDNLGSGVAPNAYSNGFHLEDASMGSGYLRHYIATIFNVSGNTWVATVMGGTSGIQNYVTLGGGSVSLSAALTAVRVTTILGADTFDAGTINISYEG